MACGGDEGSLLLFVVPVVGDDSLLAMSASDQMRGLLITFVVVLVLPPGIVVRPCRCG